MMVPTCRYGFTPPDGGPPIGVSGLQDYSPGQMIEVDVWKLELPPERAVQFGSHVEFASHDSLLTALAQHFCNGDKIAASALLILKFDNRPKFS